jgi:hypothetical protein
LPFNWSSVEWFHEKYFTFNQFNFLSVCWVYKKRGASDCRVGISRGSGSQLCTIERRGEMKAAFEDMNDEQFRLFYLNGNLNIQELKVLSTNINNDQAIVVYQVVVENRQGTDVTKETNEREVVLNQGAGGWLIDSVRPKGTDKLIFSKGMVF